MSIIKFQPKPNLIRRLAEEEAAKKKALGAEALTDLDVMAFNTGNWLPQGAKRLILWEEHYRFDSMHTLGILKKMFGVSVLNPKDHLSLWQKMSGKEEPGIYLAKITSTKPIDVSFVFRFWDGQGYHMQNKFHERRQESINVCWYLARVPDEMLLDKDLFILK